MSDAPVREAWGQACHHSAGLLVLAGEAGPSVGQKPAPIEHVEGDPNTSA